MFAASALWACGLCHWRKAQTQQPDYEGRAHDKRIADKVPYRLPPGSILVQDTGFQGFDLSDVTVLQPKKKPRGGELSAAEKTENKRISRLRMPVEHVIGSIKRFRIIRDEIRHAELWKRDQVMLVCVGLHNFCVKQRILAQCHTEP